MERIRSRPSGLRQGSRTITVRSRSASISGPVQAARWYATGRAASEAEVSSPWIP